MENTSSRPHRRINHPATQSSWRTHHPNLIGELIILLHRTTNHPVPQESKSSCPTRERIILSHKRVNHLVHRRANHLVHRRANHLVPQESESSCPQESESSCPQESESSCLGAHHQVRVSHPVVVCCSSKNHEPSKLPKLNVYC